MSLTLTVVELQTLMFNNVGLVNWQRVFSSIRAEAKTGSKCTRVFRHCRIIAVRFVTDDWRSHVSYLLQRDIPNDIISYRQ